MFLNSLIPNLKHFINQSYYLEDSSVNSSACTTLSKCLEVIFADDNAFPIPSSLKGSTKLAESSTYIAILQGWNEGCFF